MGESDLPATTKGGSRSITKADTEAKAEKRSEKRFNVITLVLVPIFCVMLGIGGTYAYEAYSNRLRVIRYAPAPSSAMLAKPDLGAKKLAVTLDGAHIDNLSGVTIHVFNDDTDLEDVPFYLTFAPINGKPPKLIHARPKLAPEAFKEMPVQQPTDGGLRVGYEIAVLNRNHYFQVDCLFEGEQAPDVDLFTVAKGITAEPTTLQDARSSSLRTYSGAVFGSFTGITIGWVCIWIVTKVAGWWQKRPIRIRFSLFS